MSNTEVIALQQGLEQLRAAVAQMARIQGARLTRAQVLERLDIHRNTLRTYIAEKGFPTPGKDGKWLLAEILEWEAMK